MRLALLLLLISLNAIGQDGEGLRFIQNKGQWNEDIDFQARVPGGRLGVSATGFSVQLLDMEEIEHRHLASHAAINESTGQPANEPINGHYFRINLLGANGEAKAIVETPLDGHYNYFLGNDPSRWATNALAFASILYQDVYAGIDFRVSSIGNNLKYDFIVKPGADPSQIKIEYSGGAVTTRETNATFYNPEGLSPGTQYTVAVAPACTNEKDFASAFFGTTCHAPFDLSVNAITHTTAELSWSDHFSGIPYVVDYSISGTNVWLTTETALRNLSLTQLRPGTKYEVSVHINCSSETAQYVSLLFETNVYNETTIAPNPTGNKITIYPSKNLIGNRFTILDNAGRIVADGELLDYAIDLSGVPPGIYSLRIAGEKRRR